MGDDDGIQSAVPSIHGILLAGDRVHRSVRVHDVQGISYRRTTAGHSAV